MLEALLIVCSIMQAGTPAPVSAAPTLDLDPPQVMVLPGQPFRVKAKTNASVVFFDIEGVQQLPDDWPLSDRKTTFYGMSPQANGQFVLTATVFGGDQRVIKKVPIIVGVNPLPPIPPGPGPAPPPSDPLFAELQALYTADKSPAKAASANSLASLYSTAGQAALKDESVATTGQFLAKLQSASNLLLEPKALDEIRNRLRAEFALCLGKKDSPLTPELRAKASECLNRLAQLVGALR